MEKVISVLCQLTSISILKLSIDNFQNQFEIPTYSKLTKTLTQVLCNCQQFESGNKKNFLRKIFQNNIENLREVGWGITSGQKVLI